MAKSKSTTGDEKAKATVKRLRADLKQSEVKRADWKKRAKEAEAAVADLQTRLREVDKQAKKAAKKERAAAPSAAAAQDPSAAATDDARSPDASWTVAQLHAEARRRGVTGLSNKPKAELVKALG